MTPELATKRLILVVGKGGVGRSTVAAAIAGQLADQGRRTLLFETNANDRFGNYFDKPPVGTQPAQLANNLWAVNATPASALEEYGLMVLRFKSVYEMVFENRVTKAFLRAIPGLDDYALLGKAWFHTTEMEHGRAKWDHVVFDMPAVRGTFVERLRQLRRENLERWHFTRVLYQDVCQDVAHLRTELDRIEALGGEGLMLRQPGSHYEAGRSHTLLKVKRFHDTEACVIEHLPGAGRHRGRLGALLVSLANGTQFHVGTGFSDAQRENPPPVGSTITFRYQELTDGGVPRFPSFVRVRTDCTK